MNSIFALLVVSSSLALAASKMVVKNRVVEEKIVSAQGCSVVEESLYSGYSGQETRYTTTMKITVKQKIESTLVQVKKSIFGKVTETVVANSTKAAPEKTATKTQSISYVARYPSEDIKNYWLKGCQDEMVFINTGSYPPPPPKPVVLEVPKKEPVKPVVPSVPTIPELPGLPIIVPPSEDPGTPIIPGVGALPDPAQPLFPIEIPN